MKKFLLRALFIIIPFLWSIYVSAQPGKEKDCSTTCFSSEVISTKKLSATCTSYELKVSFSGECAHELSHFAVGVPCGDIQDLWNSQNWSQETGVDPTTGLSGFKIDNISSFGKGSLSSFTVRFTVCATGENCADVMKCWQPQVAYKASTCVNFETLHVYCQSLKASLQKQDVSCYGASDGSLAVVIEEGQEPFTYLWSDNSTQATRSLLPAGQYAVVVRDASGAEVTLEETVRQPEMISISGITTAASCNGAADGSVDVSLSGGTGPYTFLWSNGLTTEDVQSMAAGAYMLTVTDASACSASARFTVTNTSTMNISGTSVRPDCADTNGSIDISVTGGTAPYSFAWSSDATSEDLTSIGAGLYTVTVTDGEGCVQERSFIIHEIITLSLSVVSTPTSCTDDSSGELDLTVDGGKAPYSISWSNGATTEDLTGLKSGFYTVTVVDANGCTVKGGYTVSKTTFQVPYIAVQPTCFGDNNGSITLQEPIGGTAPFRYTWENGQTGQVLTDLAPGSYSVTVTDATECSRTINITIKSPSEITASATVSGATCHAQGSFAIDLNVSGGTAPYAFNWSNGATTEDLAGLAAGNYTVVITDAHGCNISKEVIVAADTPAWSCAIDERGETVVCGSQNNALSTPILDADTYLWTVTSSDGNWSIASGLDAPVISFNAGGENSSATFTLTITKEGCAQTCLYTISACTPADEDPGGEDPGGENPGGEDPGNGGNESCEDCFATVARVIGVSGQCRTYEMEVTTNGLCRHDLSHWTLAIPCGTVSSYSNSEGWKMHYGQDPTTGLYGLKVDDISAFGKQVDSFTVTFTLCASDCELSYWDPTVAYKAGQCVAIETIQVQSATEMGRISVYPNPFNEVVHFEWNPTSEPVNLEIIDQYGNTVLRSTMATGKQGSSSITLESSSLPKGMYYYRLTIDDNAYSGKISKR